MPEANAGNLTRVTQSDALLANRPAEWAVTHAPAENTKATISKAAGSGAARHVCTAISGRLVGGASAPAAINAVVNLRDGATGAGTILASFVLAVAAVAGDKDGFALTGLNIIGSAATAMTLEFAAAGGANTFESVALAGYTVS